MGLRKPRVPASQVIHKWTAPNRTYVLCQIAGVYYRTKTYLNENSVETDILQLEQVRCLLLSAGVPPETVAELTA